jgi:hypothetical protein
MRGRSEKRREVGKKKKRERSGGEAREGEKSVCELRGE